VAATPAAAALAFVATLVLLTGFWAWLIAGVRAAISWRLVGDSAATRIATFLQSRSIPPRLPLITLHPRQPVPWSAIDLLSLLGLYVLGSAAAAQAADIHIDETYFQAGSFGMQLTHEELLIAAGTLTSLAILAIALPLIGFRTGATPRDFGLSPRDFAGDLRIGLIAFVMLAPPVYAVQGLLVSFWQESKHPLVEMFKEQPSNTFFAIVFVSAAIVAPLFEEMVFRVLLQGFLEKMFAHPHAESQSLDAPQSSVTEMEDEGLRDVPPTIGNNPYASPGTINHTPRNDESVEAHEPCHQSSWPSIIISSSIFAALHYTHGPDWVPLFFLALGLGYLYQRTHRLVPVLVVHSLLNALSMWGLWVTVHQPPAS
jgi:membrane protease YdiL (CAAX protease family)